jgi:hypothetical protein
MISGTRFAGETAAAGDHQRKCALPQLCLKSVGRGLCNILLPCAGSAG